MKKISQDLKLLTLMTKDLQNQKNIYKPGLYWNKRSLTSIKLIKKYGLNQFRNYENVIGESYSDLVNVDFRNTLEKKSFTRSFLYKLSTTLPILNKLFDKQVKISIDLHNNYLELFENMILKNSRYKNLKEKYIISDSTSLGNPTEKFFDKELKKNISILYLNLLDQHDHLTNHIDFTKLKSVFEIGGGFGINTHLLIENYPNIRKIIYLDIPPNLYVGTQYLKALYGECVYDYKLLKNKNKIKFKPDESLEIFCIAPWQIEDLDETVDLFFNSHSFVEMPEISVENYAKNIIKNDNLKTKLALISYDGFNLDSTFHPDKLMDFFSNRNNWIKYLKPSLTKSNRKNHFYISQ